MQKTNLNTIKNIYYFLPNKMQRSLYKTTHANPKTQLIGLVASSSLERSIFGKKILDLRYEI